MYKTSISREIYYKGLQIIGPSRLTFYGYEDVIREDTIGGKRYALIFSSATKSYHWERSDNTTLYILNDSIEKPSHSLTKGVGQRLYMLPMAGVGCPLSFSLLETNCNAASYSLTSIETNQVGWDSSNIDYNFQTNERAEFQSSFRVSYEKEIGVSQIYASSFFRKELVGVPHFGYEVNENASDFTELIGSRIKGKEQGILTIPFRVRLSNPIFISSDTLEMSVICRLESNKEALSGGESVLYPRPQVEVSYSPNALRQIKAYYLNHVEIDSSGLARIAMPATVFKGDTIIEKLRFYVLPTHRKDTATFRLQNFTYRIASLQWFVPEVINDAESKTISLRIPDIVRLNAAITIPSLDVTSRKRITIPVRLVGNLREAFENGISTVQTALLIDSAICDYSLVARASDGRGRIPITFRLSGSSDTAYTEVSATFLANAQRATSSGFTDTLSVTTGTMTAEPVSLTRGLVTFTVQPERPASVQVVVPTLRPTIVLPRLEATAGERLTIGMTMTGLDTLNQYYLPSTIEFGLRFNASLLEPLDGLASELSLQNSTRTIYRYLFSGNSYAYQPNSELSFVVRGAFGNDTATSLGATIRTQDGGIRIVPTVQQGSVRMRGNTAGGAFQFYSPKSRLLMTINPNPTQDVATLSYTATEQGIIEIVVFNTLGTKVFSRNVIIEAKTFEERLDLSSLPPGVYSVRILSGTSSDALRLVKL